MAADRLRRWTVILRVGEVLECTAADWADTLIVVERGELEVQCRGGQRAGFAAGAILTLAGLPVRCLRNRGSEPLVLSAVRR